MAEIDPKLIVILKSLSQDEFKKLKKYIFSPFFNSSEQITTLFKLLENGYPHFAKVDKEEIFRSIYPREKYKDKKIRDLFTRLNELVENFLGQLEYEKRELLGKSFILKQLASKDLGKHFISVSKEADIKLEKQPLRDSNYLFNRFNLFKEKRAYLLLLEKLGKQVPLYEDISEEIDLFTNYSIYKILELWLLVFAQGMSMKHKYEFKILDKIIDYLGENPVKEYPGIMILYKIKLLDLYPENEHVYFEIRELLKDNITKIDTEELRTIFVELFNYTKLRSLKRNPVFKKENYSILKDSIENGLYPKEGNYFSESSYITVVATALMEKDFEWTKEFMDNHKNLLNPDVRENAYNYCQAVYDYRTGNYGSALRRFARVTIDDFYYQMRVKNHQLKIYYETADFEMAKNVIDTFRHFLSTTKLLPDFVKLRFVTYVNFTSRVINVQLGGDVRNLIDIEKEILNTVPEKLENKLWLLEQISKIKR